MGVGLLVRDNAHATEVCFINGVVTERALARQGAMACDEGTTVLAEAIF